MPSNYVKKLAGGSKKKESSLEKDWKRAKKIAKEQGKGDRYGLVTHIFQSIAGIKKKKRRFVDR
mgnify:CR=1 FL=1